MKLRTKVGLTGIALATTAAVLVASPNATSASGTKSFAYGVAIGGQGKQPYAEYPAGPTKGGADLPDQLGPLASGGVLTVTAGNDQATAKVTNLTLGSAVDQLPDQLKNGISQLSDACTVFDQAGDADQAVNQLNDAIHQIPGFGGVADLPTMEEASKFCNELLDADIPNLAHVGTLLTECHGDTGSVTLTDVSVLGAKQPVLEGPAPKNQQLLPPQLAPAAKITLNRQTPHSDGSITVDGLALELGGQEVAVLASTTCGIPIDTPKTHKPGRAPTPPRAPAPKPVHHSVPVTG